MINFDEIILEHDPEQHRKALNEANKALLNNANIHNISSLQMIRQYCHNPQEFQIVDCYSEIAIDVSLFNRLTEKYPEEFV